MSKLITATIKDIGTKVVNSIPTIPTIKSTSIKPVKKEKPFVTPKIPTDSLEELELIFKLSASDLKQYLINRLATLNYKVQSEDGFIIANPKSKNTTPVMFLAHMDTVHRELCSEIWYTKDKNKWMSTEGIGGDDRCGIWMILQTIIKSEKKPIVLFTEEEEIGGVGATKYVKYIDTHKDETPDVNFLIEFDRANSNDAVYYDCDNKDFETFISQFGFVTAWGSFSDISEVAPALGVAAVNLSSGYYHAHTTDEYVVISEMIDNLNRGVEIINSEFGVFEYVERQYPKTSSVGIYVSDYYRKKYSGYYGYDGYGYDYDYDYCSHSPYGSGYGSGYSEEEELEGIKDNDILYKPEEKIDWSEDDYNAAYMEYENPKLVELNKINSFIVSSIETFNDNGSYTSDVFDEMLINRAEDIYFDNKLNVYVYESSWDVFVQIHEATIVPYFGCKIVYNEKKGVEANAISQKAFEILMSEI